VKVVQAIILVLVLCMVVEAKSEFKAEQEGFLKQ
jgi:hypothetical protein